MDRLKSIVATLDQTVAITSDFTFPSGFRVSKLESSSEFSRIKALSPAGSQP
jgi:hypothetical protein